MKSDWKQYQISDFLLRKKETIVIDDKKIYKRITIKMHNKGICVRDEVIGSRIGTKNQFTVKAGWLLLSKIDARNGAFGIIPEEADGGIITGNFWAYELDLSKIDPQFFFYFSHSRKFLDFCIASSQGATNRRYLQEELFLNREIVLPPLPEQKRIVKKIKEIEEKVIEAKKELDKSNIWRESTLPSVWSILRKKFKEFAWIESSVGDICENPQYGYTAPATHKNVGPKMLRITDIQNSRVNWESVPFCFYIEKDKKKYLLKDNDILFARTGGTTGKSYFVQDPPESVFASYLIRLRTKETAVLPDYLYQYFQSRYYWDQVIDKKNGSAQPNLNGSKLKKIKIFYPEKIENQKTLLEFLRELREKTEMLRLETARKQKYISALMPSLLSKAFNGEL